MKVILIRSFFFQILTQNGRDEVIKSVKKMFKTLGVGNDEELHQVTLITEDDNNTKKKRNKRAIRDDINVDDVLKEYISNEKSSTNDEEPYDEVVEYMKSKVNYANGEDVLLWWRKHSCIYPQLSRLATALLSIPASSATSERSFSEIGRILEARRLLLNPESLDSLVFLRNFRCIFVLYLLK